MFPPERIVCLTEETVETLYLLGEERRIVGISGYVVRPPHLHLWRLGPGHLGVIVSVATRQERGPDYYQGAARPLPRAVPRHGRGAAAVEVQRQ
jgi:hypothetical protein